MTTTDGDLGFGNLKIVGEQPNKGLIGSAISRLFSEVNGEFCDVLRIRNDERSTFRTWFNVNEIEHDYVAGGMSKVSDRAGQRRVGV